MPVLLLDPFVTKFIPFIYVTCVSAVAKSSCHGAE